METILSNSVGKARRVWEGGREYYVVPMTTIVPGVLNGSQGPLMYSAEENRKSVKLWDGFPLPVYHPTRNGEGVGIDDLGPEEMAQTVVGEVRNTRLGADGSLKHDGWLDVLVLHAVDESLPFHARVAPRVENGSPVELSTGLFTTNVPARGQDDRGRPYTALATRYRPDHIAILPDQVGACSLKDGCGVLVNEATAATVLGDVLTVNPFVSESQRRACYAKDNPDWDCHEWSDGVRKSDGVKLPETKADNVGNDWPEPDYVANSNPEGHNQYSGASSKAHHASAEAYHAGELADKAAVSAFEPHEHAAVGDAHEKAEDAHLAAREAHREAHKASGSKAQATAHRAAGAMHAEAARFHAETAAASRKVAAKASKAMAKNQGGVAVDDKFWDRYFDNLDLAVNAFKQDRHGETGQMLPKAGSSVKQVQGQAARDHAHDFAKGKADAPAKKVTEGEAEAAVPTDVEAVPEKVKVLNREVPLKHVTALVYNAAWPAERRDATTVEDFAGPNRTYPIGNQDDLDSAVALLNEAPNPPAVKARIRSIAARKGLTLPRSWAAPATNALGRDVAVDLNVVAAELDTITDNACGCGGATGADTHNAAGGEEMAALTATQRAGLVRRAIGAGLAAEADVAVLNKLPDKALLSMNAAVKPDGKPMFGEKEVTDNEPGKGGSLRAGGIDSEATNLPTPGTAVSVTDGPATKLLAKNSVADWLKSQNAPPEVEAAVLNSIQAEREQKADIARRLVANAKTDGQRKAAFNRYMGKTLAELKEDAALHLSHRPAPPTDNAEDTEYDRLFLSGGAGPTGNARGGEVTADDDLPLPRTMSAILNGHRAALATNRNGQSDDDCDGLHG